MRYFKSTCAAMLLAAISGFAGAEVVTTSADQTSLSLTIYNSDLALVRDSRSLSLPTGEQTLAFKEISSVIQPETALLHGDGIEVIEQNFEFDLLSPQTLLNKYVGKNISIIRENKNSGEREKVDAKVLSNANGVVLQVGSSIETELGGYVIYPDVPPNLRERPTLTMLVDNEKQNSQDLELSYLTRGLTWRADYVAELNSEENRLDLKGWVTLTNRSGAEYRNAKLQLVAGDVNRAQYAPAMMEDQAVQSLARAPKAGRPRVEQEQLFEYHLYTVGRPTTILENQSKQIALLQENGGVCKKELILRSRNPNYYWVKMGEIEKSRGVEVFLKMRNDKASNLGLPKPAGIVRVYKKDSGGFSQFIGEDQIHHTPENEEINIKLGEAFDVTADRVQTDFIQLRKIEQERIQESAYEITLKNAKDEKISVVVEEMLPGDWDILQESHPHRKESSTIVRWEISVPAKGKSSLTYRVRTKF